VASVGADPLLYRRDVAARAHPAAPGARGHRPRDPARRRYAPELARRGDDRPSPRRRLDRCLAELPRDRDEPGRDAGPARRDVREDAPAVLRFFTNIKSERSCRASRTTSAAFRASSAGRSSLSRRTASSS
jgi:hypothetical protein